MGNNTDSRREQIYNEVIRILSSDLEVSAEDIERDMDLNTELPFDSLQLYEFVIDLEEAYNIKLPDEMLDQMKTVDDIVSLIMQLTEGK
ncbi:MAG: acyl carrier protein [Clostridiales bacterium]|nr:acyl carrier protein [Clostridiales bacterium]MBR6487828.1 acyl carrier protein [Clostridiales bacterium]